LVELLQRLKAALFLILWERVGRSSATMKKLRLATFMHMHRLRRPTGVGKHIFNMTESLARRSDVDLQILAPRDQLQHGRVPDDIPFSRLPCTALPLPRRQLEALWQLTNRPKLDHWCNGFDWVYCASDAYIPARRVRVATTIHSLMWFDPNLPSCGERRARRTRARMHRLFSHIVRYSDVIFTVSPFLSQQIEQLFDADPSKLQVVGNAVEQVYFTAAHYPRQSVDRPYVLVVGGLTEIKGGDYTLAVAKRLSRRMPDLEIRIVGESESRYVHAAKSLPNITHMGYIGIEQGLPRLVRGAVALLFLSRYESFGIPAAEAMAAGTPPVVSGVAALPDLVGDGGVVVEVDNPDAIAELLVALSRDDSERERLAIAAQRRAQRYTWARCAETVVERLRAEG
jgi:glycosyltransferase involved in cell wall biosynthesis